MTTCSPIPLLLWVRPIAASGTWRGAGLAAELGEDLGGLGHAGGAERMAAADEPAARVDDDVAAVVAAPGRHERPGLALRAEAQLLVGDQLGDREAVVHLGEVDVGRRRRRPSRTPTRAARASAGQCA